MADNLWWTVTGTVDSTQEPFTTYVRAPDVRTAKSEALRKADDVIIVGPIFEGKIKPVDEPADAPTPIHGRGHALRVVSVAIRMQETFVPVRCPACRADLRRVGAITQRDLATISLKGHVPAVRGHEVSAERDQGSMELTTIARAVAIDCARCGRSLWSGMPHGKEASGE